MCITKCQTEKKILWDRGACPINIISIFQNQAQLCVDFKSVTGGSKNENVSNGRTVNTLKSKQILCGLRSFLLLVTNMTMICYKKERHETITAYKYSPLGPLI